MTPPAPAPAAAGPDNSMIGALTGMMGTFVSVEQPGLPIIGQYTGSGGMLMDFDGGEVTLNCGQAHVKAPYTVENSPAQFLVHVQNSGERLRSR